MAYYIQFRDETISHCVKQYKHGFDRLSDAMDMLSADSEAWRILRESPDGIVPIMERPTLVDGIRLWSAGSERETSIL
jgi:hypothetical protein